MRTFSKLLMSQPGQQLNTIHKLSNISRIKGDNEIWPVNRI